ncbi:lysophospholipid acyltransferase family protein [candidate division KSB1 bacterium]
MKNILRKIFPLKILIHLLILRPFVKLLFGINIYGKENLEGLKNFILISNHNSHLDLLLLFYCLPVSHITITHALAAEEYFSKSKILFFFVNYLFNPVWVSRGDAKKSRKTADEMKNILDKGHNIIMFPEGTRGTAGVIQPFKTGIGRLTVEYHNTPVVPVYLFGPERALPKTYFLPVPIWMNVIVAPPQTFIWLQ